MPTTDSNVIRIDHPVLDPVLAKVASFASDYGTVAARLAAADGDTESATRAWVDSTDNAAAVKLRNQISELTAKLNDMATKAVADSAMSAEDKVKLTKEAGELKNKFRDAQLAVRKLAGVLSVDDVVVNDALVKIGDPTRSGKGRPVGSGGGSTGPRASVNVFVKGKSGDKELNQNFENLAAASKASGLDLTAIQTAYAEAGKVALADISSIKTAQEFKVGDFTFSTTPKARKNAVATPAQDKAA